MYPGPIRNQAFDILLRGAVALSLTVKQKSSAVIEGGTGIPLFLTEKINPSYFPLEINGRFERIYLDKKISPAGGQRIGFRHFISNLKNSHFRDILLYIVLHDTGGALWLFHTKNYFI